jgi:hypothetical protein
MASLSKNSHDGSHDGLCDHQIDIRGYFVDKIQKMNISTQTVFPLNDYPEPFRVNQQQTNPHRVSPEESR